MHLVTEEIILSLLGLYEKSPRRAILRGFLFLYDIVENASKPLFLSEIHEAENDDSDAGDYYDRVGGFKLQFRHIAEIHSVPSGDKGQRHKDSSHDSENSHYTILLYIQL